MGQSETLDSANFFNVHMAGQETAIKIGIADLVSFKENLIFDIRLSSQGVYTNHVRM
jgi:hypothetical protein